MYKRKGVEFFNYIYSKGHYQKVNLVILAEGYKKQQI